MKKRIIILFSLVFMALIMVGCTKDDNVFKEKQIKNLELNTKTKEVLKDDNQLQIAIIEYLKDYMEVYNKKAGIELIEPTEKSDKFILYYDNYTPKEANEKHTIIMAFAKLRVITSKATINDLKFEDNLKTDEIKVVIDESYNSYIQKMEEQINYLIQEYCK